MSRHLFLLIMLLYPGHISTFDGQLITFARTSDMFNIEFPGYSDSYPSGFKAAYKIIRTLEFYAVKVIVSGDSPFRRRDCNNYHVWIHNESVPCSLDNSKEYTIPDSVFLIKLNLNSRPRKFGNPYRFYISLSPFPAFNLTCSEKDFELTVDKLSLSPNFLFPDQPYQLGESTAPACIARNKSNNLILASDYNRCGVVFKEHIGYHVVMRRIGKNSQVERFAIHCRDVRKGFVISSVYKVLNNEIYSGTSRYTSETKLYNPPTKTFTNLVGDSSIKAGMFTKYNWNTSYLTIEIKGKLKPRHILSINSCWVTNSTNQDDKKKFYFFKNGCGEPRQNLERNKTSNKSDAFRYYTRKKTHETIWKMAPGERNVHCQVNICSLNNPVDIKRCDPVSCLPRKMSTKPTSKIIPAVADGAITAAHRLFSTRTISRFSERYSLVTTVASTAVNSASTPISPICAQTGFKLTLVKQLPLLDTEFSVYQLENATEAHCQAPDRGKEFRLESDYKSCGTVFTPGKEDHTAMTQRTLPPEHFMIQCQDLNKNFIISGKYLVNANHDSLETSKLEQVSYDPTTKIFSNILPGSLPEARMVVLYSWNTSILEIDISVLRLKPEQKLSISSCWVTNSTNQYETDRFSFLNNGCANPKPIKKGPDQRIERLYKLKYDTKKDSTGNIRKMVPGERYIHCEVNICSQDDDPVDIKRCDRICDNSVELTTTANPNLLTNGLSYPLQNPSLIDYNHTSITESRNPGIFLTEVSITSTVVTGPTQSVNTTDINTTASLTPPIDITAQPPLVTGQIFGVVRDAITNVGLGQVEVLARNADNRPVPQSFTSPKGTYKLTLPIHPNYTVIFHTRGYHTALMPNIEVKEHRDHYLESILFIDEKISGNGSVSGTVRGASTGLPEEGVLVEIFPSLNPVNVAPISVFTTNNSGHWMEILNTGYYTVKFSKNGFINTTNSITVLAGYPRDDQDAVLSPVLVDQETRISLTWHPINSTEKPVDLDLHVHFSNGTYNSHVYHIFKKMPGCHLDIDDRTGRKPETITITNNATGVYRFSVHDLTLEPSSSSMQLARSSAKVQVYRGTSVVEEFVPDDTAGNLWTVFEMRLGNITRIGSITYQADSYNIN